MINKYEGMTIEQLARTLSPRMRDALHGCLDRDAVVASTNTSVALIDRGLVLAGREHIWTERGNAVAEFLWPDEAEHGRLAATYERESGKSAAGLSTDVLRSLLDPEPVAGVEGTSMGELRRTLHVGRSCCASTDGDVHIRTCDTDEARRQWAPRPGRAARACCSSLVGAKHEGTCASVGARCERAVAAMARPVPRTTDEFDTGEAVWRVGDRVQPDGPICEQGDVWRIRAIYVPDDREPYAGIELVQRVGGLGYGTTGSGVPLRHLRRVTRPSPPPVPAADVLRKLRDDHLPSWLRGCMENDQAMQRRDRETDPERYPMHAADFRTMIEDVARENGIVL